MIRRVATWICLTEIAATLIILGVCANREDGIGATMAIGLILLVAAAVIYDRAPRRPRWEDLMDDPPTPHKDGPPP